METWLRWCCLIEQERYYHIRYPRTFSHVISWDNNRFRISGTIRYPWPWTYRVVTKYPFIVSFSELWQLCVGYGENVWNYLCPCYCVSGHKENICHWLNKQTRSSGKSEMVLQTVVIMEVFLRRESNKSFGFTPAQSVITPLLCNDQ